MSRAAQTLKSMMMVVMIVMGGDVDVFAELRMEEVGRTVLVVDGYGLAMTVRVEMVVIVFVRRCRGC